MISSWLLPSSAHNKHLYSPTCLHLAVHTTNTCTVLPVYTWQCTNQKLIQSYLSTPDSAHIKHLYSPTCLHLTEHTSNTCTVLPVYTWQCTHQTPVQSYLSTPDSKYNKHLYSPTCRHLTVQTTNTCAVLPVYTWQCTQHLYSPTCLHLTVHTTNTCTSLPAYTWQCTQHKHLYSPICLHLAVRTTNTCTVLPVYTWKCTHQTHVQSYLSTPDSAHIKHLYSPTCLHLTVHTSNTCTVLPVYTWQCIKKHLYSPTCLHLAVHTQTLISPAKCAVFGGEKLEFWTTVCLWGWLTILIKNVITSAKACCHFLLHWVHYWQDVNNVCPRHVFLSLHIYIFLNYSKKYIMGPDMQLNKSQMHKSFDLTRRAIILLQPTFRIEKPQLSSFFQIPVTSEMTHSRRKE